MIQTGFESRVKVQQIIDSQLPEYVLDESPKAVDFLKQYYIGQEYQGGPIDITDNLDQYLKLDNLTPEVVVGLTTLSVGLSTSDTTIPVTSTKGFPENYGLLKINDEVITYTGLTTNTFTGCIRGFCGITSYHETNNQEELVFSDTTASTHTTNAKIQNLSSLFLKEFYKKTKSTLTPGLEEVPFVDQINAGNFIKESRSLYEAKGTDESFRILFNVLYGETPKVVNLEDFLIKPSSANFTRREVAIGDVISGDITKLVGQTIFKEGDTLTNASIAEINAFTSQGASLTENKQYYKLSLFLGYSNTESAIQGDFKITPTSKSLSSVDIDASTIMVDSTIGFGQTGTLVSGGNTSIYYTSKSINQFFGVSGITSAIANADDIIGGDIYYGYENGDTTKKVRIRLNGVLSGFEQTSSTLDVDEGQEISVKNVGNLIVNPTTDRTYEEIFANSWIYNTGVRYKVDGNAFSATSTFTLLDFLDRSSLKKGDTVEILRRGGVTTQSFVSGSDTAYVIDDGLDPETPWRSQSRAVTLSEAYTGIGEIDIRRVINTARSSGAPLEFNPSFSDVQNVYVGSGKTAYVASNSLPSGVSDTLTGITTSFKNTITTPLESFVAVNFVDPLSTDPTYTTTIRFDNAVPFMTGDAVYYDPTGASLTGLETGRYYVDVVSPDKRDIKLYNSPALIDGVNYLPMKVGTASTSDQKFTLFSQKDGVIGPQKIFKQFSLEQSTATGTQIPTIPGPTGLLINGVEITNYKSTDKVYYGPLASSNILNQGTGYDVINLPYIEVAAGLGTTALVQPVLTGTMTEAVVDPQGFNIDRVLSIDVTGGNGTAVIEPLIESKKRSVSFDARDTIVGGGVSIAPLNTIQFPEDHSFVDGQEIVYNAGGDTPLSVGIGTSTLSTYASYFANVVNSTTITLHNTKSDAVDGINPIGIQTSSGGIQKFQTLADLKTVIGTKVVDGGTFTNRQLRVQPTDISTDYNTVNFDNHGFNDGDLIEYKTWGTVISGIVTANQYYVSKIDDNSFKLADAGVGGIDPTNYERKDTVLFATQGVGEQIFKYPDISVAVNYVPVGGTTNVESILLTPTVRGSIVDSYLYEKGTGYGSTIINFESQPLITIKNGKEAILTPVIDNGQITSVNVQNSGSEYYSIPDIDITDTSGKGSGAIIRPVITNRSVSSIVVVNPGIGYSSLETSIKVTSAGKNGKIEAHIRPLTIDINKKYDSNELLLLSDNKLKYTVCGYGQTFRKSFGEVGSGTTLKSKIIGWAYDGNPIYGPYGGIDPEDKDSKGTRLRSGYTASTSNVIDRPSFIGLTTSVAGMFVEDYKFDNSGDLDENNGRFSKTPEFPDGVYAYHATIHDSTYALNPSGPQFPYFIGNSYRSLPLEQNFDQSLDFAKTDLVRNTFPYRSSAINVDNDYIIEPNEIAKQKVLIESVTAGSIDDVNVVSAGSSYKVGDPLTFDDTDTEGSGLSAKVSSLVGEDVSLITNGSTTYSNVVFSRVNADSVRGTITGINTLSDQDVVSLSGFTTSYLSALNGRFSIGVNTVSTILTETLPVGTGVTEVVVADIPSQVSVGSSIGIGTETGKILNIYRTGNVLTVMRGVNGHDTLAGAGVTYYPDSFTFNQSTDTWSQDSQPDDIVYFNSNQAVGFGTTAGAQGKAVSFTFANRTVTRTVPCGRIYMENNPFVEGQQVTYTQGGSTALTYVSVGSTPFTWDTPANLVPTGAGSGYITGSHTRVPTTGGTGTEMYVDITVNGSGVVTTVNIDASDPGRGYTVGDNLTINGAGGSNATFRIATLAANVPTSSYYIRQPVPLPASSTLYISNPTPTTVGLKTEKTGPDMLFTTGGSDNDLFSLESNYDQITGTVTRINTEVTTVNPHGLKVDDTVTLEVTAGLTTGVGIGKTDILISRQSGTGYILVDPQTCTNANTDAVTDSFTIIGHTFNTEDKIYFTTTGSYPGGLSARAYFVYVVDANTFQLCETYKDTQSPTNIVPFTSNPAGTRTFSRINPSLQVIRNNSPIFNLKDASLSGYNLKFYYDQEFKNEFVSTATTTTNFNITTSGVVGSGVSGAKTINYDTSLPDKLYYTLEKSGYISTADTTVQNYSEIKYVDSKYNGTFKVAGVSTYTFNINAEEIPDNPFFVGVGTLSNLKYNTTSTNTIGGVNGVNIISGGSDYKKLPTFVGSSSTQGLGAYAVVKSKSIGNINQTRVINEGFEYSSDPTLRPQAFISPIVTINESNTVGVVTVVDGGSGYTNAPVINVVNTTTRESIDSGILQAELSGNSIHNVKIVEPPYGLPETPVTLFTTNNDNGIGINTIQSDSALSGIFTCYIPHITPSAFAPNDRVFVEDISKIVGSGGTGFNSADVGYKFGRVVSYVGGVAEDAVKVTYEDDSISTNCGLADTIQTEARLIKRTLYPTFSVYQIPSNFIIGEKLITNNIERDLFIVSSDDDFIKIRGTYVLSVGEVITGKISGVVATIENIRNNEGIYNIKYGVEKNIGWSDDIGKLSSDNQVTPNNDYYQNLSYTVKSSKTFDELRSPVNGLLHTSGLKNFADTGISSTSSAGMSGTSVTVSVHDIISDNRVDTINDYANAEDISNITSSSKLVKLTNKKLTPYQVAKSNEVLIMDNINTQFSNLDGEPSEFLNIENQVGQPSFVEYTIRITNLTNTKVQLVELVLLNNGTNIVVLERTEIDDTSRIGSFSIFEDVYGNKFLRFTPLPDAYDYDYDLKVLKSKVNDTARVASQPVGFSSMISSVGVAITNPSYPSGITTAHIVSIASTQYDSVLVKTALTNTVTQEMSYVEIYAGHDNAGTVFKSEAFLDNDEPAGYSDQIPGNFKVGIMTASGGGIATFFVGFENTAADDIQYKAKVVTFDADATAGIGTYRFKVTGQPDQAERTALYQSNQRWVATPANPSGWTVVSLDKNLFNSAKTIVEVGSNSANRELHQVSWTYDGTNVFTQQGPILSFGQSGVGVTAGFPGGTGIGTCWAEIDGSNIVLKYDPSIKLGSVPVTRTHALTLGFYTQNDIINTPNTNDLTYGEVVDSISIHEYNALNGQRINKKQFKITTDTIPLFAKTFNPADTNVVSGSTFNIDDHFFRSGEAISYKPGSTFLGVSSSPMLYSRGSVAGEVPSTVYIIRDNKDSFSISTTRTGGATPGDPITITNDGTGNAHEFSMPLANTKSIITIDNIIQSPIAYSSLKFNLLNNADPVGYSTQALQGISTTRTTFALSGISSIVPNDLLRFDDEYVKVINIGTGTTSVGPITNFGSYNLITVERGIVGTVGIAHTDGTEGRVYRGSYNIVGPNINFTEPPRGNSQILKNQSNLPFPRSEFTGRTFLRNDYSTNTIYDDLSDQFTGIGATFNLTVGGASTTGIGSTGGNAIVTINNLFQRPSTENNSNGNFIINATSTGITSSVTFTGITSSNGIKMISDVDVNQNQLPRGGVIVSLGSSEGLGYAPLRNSIAYAEVGAGGSISRIVDTQTVGQSIPVSSAIYNNLTGEMEVTTAEPHNFEVGIVKDVKFSGLAFTCNNSFDVYDADYNPTTGEMVLNIGDHPLGIGQSVGIATGSLGFKCALDGYATTKYYPRAGAGSSDPITGVSTAISAVTHNTITINVLAVTPSTNTGIHSFVSASPDAVIARSGYSGITSTVFPYAGTGLASTSLVYPIERVSIGNFVHRFESALTGAVYRGGNYPHTYVAASTDTNAINGSLKPTGADYNAVTGVLTLTFASPHGIANGGNVTIANGSLAFTCSRDNHKTIHKYPRSTDPAYGAPVTATVGGDNKVLTVPVGTSPIVSKTPTAATYTPSTGLLEMTVGSGHGWTSAVPLTNAVTNAVYNKIDGQLVITSASHNLITGNRIKLNDGCLSFTCSKDGNKKVVAYPRISDPSHAKWLPVVTVIDANNFSVYGIGFAANLSDQYNHTFVSAVADGILKATDTSYAGITTGGLSFSCDRDDYSTLHAYPRLTDPAGDGAVLAVQANTTTTITVDVGKLPSYRFTTNVGINSIPHKYVGRGYAYPWYGDANVGSAYRGSVSIGITDIPFDHNFVSVSTPIRKLAWTGSQVTPTNADYNPSTGLMVVTAAGHGLSNGNNIGIATNSLTFTCSKDDYATEHTYPRTTDPAHNTLKAVSNVTTDTFTVDVGKSVGSGGAVTASVGAGGTLAFSLTGLGTNYANPQLVIPEPSYARLGVTGVSRLGDGATTDTGTGLLLNIEVGAASTVGIGSTLFSVKNWEIERNGYGFRRGDVFTPVGLVTCGVTGLGVTTPQATFEVVDTFSDNFGMWNFGNMDYIDSIAELQDGVQTRFDLKYNGTLLSFEADDSGDFPGLDLSTCLFIMINGTIQEPGVAYNFAGGSSFLFTEAPKAEDNVAIFFYRGTYGQDTELVTNIYPSIKRGDIIQLDKITIDKENQGNRTVVGIPTSNIVETLLYKGAGISTEPKSLNWTKQKSDKLINGVLVSKVRDALEPLIFPTGKLIGNIPASVTHVYLDDASDFDYEKDVTPASTNPIAIEVVDQKPIVGASLTATVAGGVVTALTIVDGGQGYVGATTSIYISAPPEVGVGIGTTATATAIVTNGVISGVDVSTAYGGSGYDTTNPPNVLVSTPPPIVDTISGINSITNYNGPITKIESVTGVGVTKAIRFTLAGSNQPDNFPLLLANMPIYISGTTNKCTIDAAGGKVTTSVGSAWNSTVSIGTTMFDNIYNITSIGSNGSTRTITCNVLGSGSFTTLNGTVLNPLGSYSIGILNNPDGSGGFHPLTRKNAVAINIAGFTNTEPTGLSTYPTVSRRNVGLRTTGSIQPS